MSEKKNKTKVGEVAIYDARQLGVPRMLVLGVQHTFAMFGATVLVPILTGLNVSTTLLMAGLGTLLFHLITKGKVPAFLGSSFAFLGGYSAVAPRLADGASNAEMLPYACGGVLVAGLVYVLMSALISVFGIRRILRFFPPVVTGPIIISLWQCSWARSTLRRLHLPRFLQWLRFLCRNSVSVRSLPLCRLHWQL